MSNVETITLSEFHSRLKSQGVTRDHFAFKCPMCATVQSAQSFICAGAGKDFDAVEKYVGFTCVGRLTGAGPSRKEPDGKPCDWTLGGLLKLHKLEVQIEDGDTRPIFEVATPAEARALVVLNAAAQTNPASIQESDNTNV